MSAFDDRRHLTRGALAMALTQSQLLAAVAERAEFTKADAKRVVDALEAVVLDEIANAQKVKGRLT
jgi:nucleoid DNA-binding protein